MRRCDGPIVKLDERGTPWRKRWRFCAQPRGWGRGRPAALERGRRRRRDGARGPGRRVGRLRRHERVERERRCRLARERRSVGGEELALGPWRRELAQRARGRDGWQPGCWWGRDVGATRHRWDGERRDHVLRVALVRRHAVALAQGLFRLRRGRLVVLLRGRQLLAARRRGWRWPLRLGRRCTLLALGWEGGPLLLRRRLRCRGGLACQVSLQRRGKCFVVRRVRVVTLLQGESESEVVACILA